VVGGGVVELLELPPHPKSTQAMKAATVTAAIFRKRRLPRPRSGKKIMKANSARRKGAILPADAVVALLVATATEMEAVCPGVSFRLLGLGVHVA
jgi:hypothetical protein